MNGRPGLPLGSQRGGQTIERRRVEKFGIEPPSGEMHESAGMERRALAREVGGGEGARGLDTETAGLIAPGRTLLR